MSGNFIRALSLAVPMLCHLGNAAAAPAGNHEFSELTRLAEGALAGVHVNDPIPGFEILILQDGQPIYH